MRQSKEAAVVESKGIEMPNRIRAMQGDGVVENGSVGSDDGLALPIGHGQNALYIGIDLGTSRTSVACSNGSRHTVLSYVGYCRDVIGERRFGKRVLFGQEALDNRLALDLVRPLRHGVIDTADPRAIQAAKELIQHAINLCEPQPGQTVFAVVGAPARASIENQRSLLLAIESLAASAMVVSEPFAVAYGLGVLSDALIIDIGAGTTDLCRMHGTMPEEADQITLLSGGDALDERLEQEILKLYPNVQLTRNMVRQIKEKYGFVSDPHQVCEVTLTEMGRPKKYDITDPLRIACHSIVPEIVDAIYRLIGTFDPEFQAKLRGNVVLAGGGSRLSGLSLLVERDLRGLGGGNVTSVEEPMYAGCNGGLKIAMEMPVRYWKALA